MNATLEAMARALFRDWFVDFGPTRAKMAGAEPYLSPNLWPLFPDRLDAERKPEGWAYEPLLDQAEWVNGAAYKNMHFSDAPDALPVIKIAELKNGRDRKHAVDSHRPRRALFNRRRRTAVFMVGQPRHFD